MSTSTMYTTNRELFSIWQQTQVSFFKKMLNKITLDFYAAGKIFAELADEYNRIPSFEEFENAYNQKNN